MGLEMDQIIPLAGVYCLFFNRASPNNLAISLCAGALSALRGSIAGSPKPMRQSEPSPATNPLMPEECIAEPNPSKNAEANNVPYRSR